MNVLSKRAPGQQKRAGIQTSKTGQLGSGKKRKRGKLSSVTWGTVVKLSCTDTDLGRFGQDPVRGRKVLVVLKGYGKE